MCQNETRDIRALLSEVTEALEDMVWQHCSFAYDDRTEIDSDAIKANIDAIEILIRLGRLERVGPPGSGRVLAKKPKTPGKGVI